MLLRLLALLLAISAFASAAAKKTVAVSRGENEDVILNVTIYIDPEAVKEALGDDLGGHYIVAEVKFSPKYTKELSIDRDDFLLRTDKDGEHTKPMAPGQVAGSSSLVLSKVEGDPEDKKSKWSIGGMGGGMGASPGTVIDTRKTKATMKNDEKENPLKKVLEAKVLPEKKVEEPVTGFLFFPMEKQKMKDLELQYGAKENRIRIRFKP